MFESTLHQTLQDRENPEEVENNGPFRVENAKSSYLGSGYYFWDDHLDLSHWWGEVHCNKSYIICQGDFTIENDEFCDLVGSRKDMKYIQEFITKLNMEQMNIGEIMTTLQELNQKAEYKGIFPFKAIRAIEIQKNSYPEIIYKFSGDRVGLISLTPRIMVCLINKDPKIFSNFKIVYPDKYVN